MKTALILEGGGMRGLYTAGVLDILMKNDIYTDVAVGVSAGALFGINYKSKQIGRVLRYNLKYAGNPSYTGWKSLLKTGNLMNKEFWFEDIPFKLDPMDCEAYRNNKTEFHAVVTNLLNGKAEYKSIFDLENEECMEYLRASGSLPFCSKPVIVNGIPYLDGGIADSIPLKEYYEKGYEKIVVVLTRPANYRKSGGIHGAGAFYKKYPEFVKTLSNRNSVYNQQCEYVERLEKEGKILVIRPSEFIDISRTETDRKIMQQMYDLGIKDAENKLKAIKEYLE
ncbi:MAG: patatin family protein [Clostridia bacterium]|nr:patatin family protein [Clostridia bacterium]